VGLASFDTFDNPDGAEAHRVVGFAEIERIHLFQESALTR
jgi:hypothetical protein